MGGWGNYCYTDFSMKELILNIILTIDEIINPARWDEKYWEVF